MHVSAMQGDVKRIATVGSPREPNLKLSRFWLQNCHKLALLYPACATRTARRVLSDALTLHCLSTSIPSPCPARTLASGTADVVAASQERCVEHWQSVAAIMRQYVLSRARVCACTAFDRLAPRQGQAWMEALAAQYASLQARLPLWRTFTTACCLRASRSRTMQQHPAVAQSRLKASSGSVQPTCTLSPVPVASTAPGRARVV